MAGFDRAVEPVRQRQRAVPFAVIISYAADLPLRQLQIDQRQRRVGPCARANQPLDPRGLVGLSDRGKAPAGSSVVTALALWSRSLRSLTSCCSERANMA